MICEILCVGTEILLGDITNTNAVYLAKELAKMGISVLRQCVVGDNDERLKESLKEAFERSDIIITTGGLGPTADDITKQRCCEVMGSKLILDETILNDMRAYFESKNIKMSPSNEVQAYVPEDGIIFKNENGTAPGFAIEKDGKCLICLPGPPREMKPMFENSAKEVLKKYASSVLVSHNIRMFGIGESNMAQEAGELLNGSNPTVAPYAKDGECLLRVTASGKDESEAEELCAPVIEKIKSMFEPYIYGIDVNGIEEAVVALLKEKHMKVAFAESCTGGLTAKRITDVPGASEVFDCAAVTYSNTIKHQVLGVNEADLAQYGAVSEPVARQMAEGILSLSGADIGVSITGIAGPGSDNTAKPVGESYIAVADREETVCTRLYTARTDRDYNRFVNSSNALNMVRQFILRKHKKA